MARWGLCGTDGWEVEQLEGLPPSHTGLSARRVITVPHTSLSVPQTCQHPHPQKGIEALCMSS
jgi:hypothetical protein